jgi:Protein of unknown function (DUF2877)
VLSGGVYLRLADDWLLVSEPGAPFGPLSIWVAGLDFGALHTAQLVHVRKDQLKIGNQGVSLERVRELRSAARFPDGGPAPGPLGSPPAGLAPGLRALAGGRLEAAVGLLAGRGEGLTPAGDDALAGYAAWRNSTGRRVAISGLAAGRSSPLGLAYLRCAERGELPAAGAALLAALRSGDRAAATAATFALRAWGASSGAAMLWGIAAGADSGESSWIAHPWGGQGRTAPRVAADGAP